MNWTSGWSEKAFFCRRTLFLKKSHKIEKLRLSIKFYTKKTSAKCSSENFSSILLSVRKWSILDWIPLRGTVVRYYLNSFCSLKFWLSLAILWIFLNFDRCVHAQKQLPWGKGLCTSMSNFESMLVETIFFILNHF